jgi:hypothetical protein
MTFGSMTRIRMSSIDVIDPVCLSKRVSGPASPPLQQTPIATPDHLLTRRAFLLPDFPDGLRDNALGVCKHLTGAKSLTLRGW